MTMTTTVELQTLGFVPCAVQARRLNITHDNDRGLGPFCRLAVDGPRSDGPGAYAWVLNDKVTYVGKAKWLRAVVQGAGIGRAFNDYTYVPPSKLSIEPLTGSRG